MGAGNLGMVTVLYYGGHYVTQVPPLFGFETRDPKLAWLFYKLKISWSMALLSRGHDSVKVSPHRDVATYDSTSPCWRVADLIAPTVPPVVLPAQGLISVGDLSTMLLYSVYAGFSISALLSYYGDLMKVGSTCLSSITGTRLSVEAEPPCVSTWVWTWTRISLTYVFGVARVWYRRVGVPSGSSTSWNNTGTTPFSHRLALNAFPPATQRSSLPLPFPPSQARPPPPLPLPCPALLLPLFHRRFQWSDRPRLRLRDCAWAHRAQGRELRLPYPHRHQGQTHAPFPLHILTSRCNSVPRPNFSKGWCGMLSRCGGQRGVSLILHTCIIILPMCVCVCRCLMA